MTSGAESKTEANQSKHKVYDIHIVMSRALPSIYSHMGARSFRFVPSLNTFGQKTFSHTDVVIDD